MRQPPSLAARALQLLAQREHSRIELRRKLLAHAERLAEANAGATAGVPADASVGAAAGAAAHPDAGPGAAAGADARREAEPEAGLGAEPEAVSRGLSRTRRAAPSAETQARVDALLDALTASGALSETRFVETRVRLRAARQGNLRIAQELARHGLEMSPAAAQELKASEYARAKEVLTRKFGAPAADAAGRARQMRFLAARGFGADVVRRVLRGADED